MGDEKAWDGQQGRELWRRDGRFVAERLLSITALVKKLMSRHPLEEDILNPCSTLCTLYTLRLPTLLPLLATPDVALYAAHWQDSNDCLREAAKELMAAATDPTLRAPTAAGLPPRLPPQVTAFQALWGEGGAPAPPSQLQLQQHSAELLCCAAACLYHDKLVPERLIAITVPCLADLVLRAPSPLSATAASMLAEGLTSPAAHHWGQHLGDLPALLPRLYAVADRLAAASAELATMSPPRSPCHPQLPGSRLHPHPPSTSPLPSRIAPHHPHQHGGGGGADRRAGGGEAGSVVACREGVAALLTALASLDPHTFLLSLRDRLSAHTAAAPPTSSTHLLSLTALVRLLHTPRGTHHLAPHLPALVDVVMGAIDPGKGPLRRACLACVMALVKELCMRFPQVAYHPDSMQLAVAPPEIAWVDAPPSAATTHPSPGTEEAGAFLRKGSPPGPVAVYDLDTGLKTYLLHVEVPGGRKGAGAGGGGSLAAICFSTYGDHLMGYSDEEGVVLGWRLQKGWAQKLARGATLLGPHKMVVVPAAEALRAMHQTPPGRVSLGYSIKFEGSGRLRLTHHDVMVYVDLDHA